MQISSSRLSAKFYSKNSHLLGVSHFFVCEHATPTTWSPTCMRKSPSSSIHLPSYPTKAKSEPLTFKVTVLVSPGCNSTLSNARKRRLSGVSEATKSLLKSSTLSLPTRLPVFFTSTVKVSTSSAVKLVLSTFELMSSLS